MSAITAGGVKMRKWFLLLLLSVCLLGSSSLLAQSNYGVIAGTVTDAQHLPIAGATVQLTASSTGAIRRVVTNQQGLFEAPALLPDDYQMNVEAPGFASSLQPVRLEVGQKLALDIPLTVGSIKQDVKVTAGSEVLRTTDASVGEVVEQKSIQELPLNGRMLIDLVLTVPGTHIGFGAQTGSTNPLYWRPGQRSAVVIGNNAVLISRRSCEIKLDACVESALLPVIIVLLAIQNVIATIGGVS